MSNYRNTVTAKGTVRSSFAANSTLRVLVDMDMVLCDFEAHLLSEFRKQYPDKPHVPLEERSGFYARDQYAKLGEDLPDKIRDIYNSAGFMYNLPAIAGACEAIKEMSTIEGVEVYICSSPLVSFDHCLMEKCQWIKEHLGQEWVEKLILAKDKTLINGHLLIDDRTHIKGAVKKPVWEHVVFTACHNTRSDLRGKRRLDNWTDGSWRDLIAEFQKRF